MKYCIYCGKELSDDAIYCSNCGKSQDIDIPINNEEIELENEKSNECIKPQHVGTDVKDCFQEEKLSCDARLNKIYFENGIFILTSIFGREKIREPLQNIILLYYKEFRKKSGIIVFAVRNSENSICINFGGEQVDNFRKLSEILKKYCEFLDLNYLQATFFYSKRISKMRDKIEYDNLGNQIVTKKQFKKILRDNIRQGYKEHYEEQRTCLQCGKLFIWGNFDYLKSAAVLLGSPMFYGVNNFKDPDKCPNCGSRRCTITQFYYFTNKKKEIVGHGYIIKKQ